MLTPDDEAPVPFPKAGTSIDYTGKAHPFVAEDRVDWGREVDLNGIFHVDEIELEDRSVGIFGNVIYVCYEDDCYAITEDQWQESFRQ